MAILHYGADSYISLDSAEGTSPVECGLSRAKPQEDLHLAVRRALEEPLDYPPLRMSLMPDDRVVLALDRGLPRAAEIVAAVVAVVLGAGVEPERLSVLRDPLATALADPRSLLDPALVARITLIDYDSADRASMAYLGANAANEAILIHRALHEADVVLPIGCLRPHAAAGYFGIHSVIYPNFSDEKTRAGFCSPEILENKKHRSQLAKDVEEAAWALGIPFTIQVVPDADGGAVAVVAGETEAVRRQSRQLYADSWAGDEVPRASLVVAAISGGAEQQTWENLGRAISAARALAKEDGSIAICCEVSAKPGPAVQQMARSRSREGALRQIGKHPASDALTAAQIALAAERGSIYVLGGLSASLCEHLDITPVTVDELARLVRHYDSVVLLSNAPLAMVKALEE